MHFKFFSKCHWTLKTPTQLFCSHFVPLVKFYVNYSVKKTLWFPHLKILIKPQNNCSLHFLYIFTLLVSRSIKKWRMLWLKNSLVFPWEFLMMLSVILNFDIFFSDPTRFQNPCGFWNLCDSRQRCITKMRSSEFCFRFSGHFWLDRQWRQSVFNWF